MEETAQTQVIATQGRGNKLSKIALIIFGFLVLIVASEFAYLWYTQKGREKIEESGIKEVPIVNDFVAETPLPEITDGSLYPEKAFFFADHIQAIKDVEKDEFVRSALASYTVRGNILEAMKEEKIVDGVTYPYKIKIESPARDKTLSFWFSNQEIDFATIVLVSGSQAGQRLSFEDIKPGQFLTMKITFDLLDNTPDTRLFLEVSSFSE